MDWWIAALAVLAGNFVQGCTGFGLALVSVPLLLMVYDIKVVTPLAILLSFSNNIFVVAQAYKNLDKKIVTSLVLGSILGIPLGIYALTAVADIWMKLGTGIFIIVTTIFLIRDYRFPIKNEKFALVPTGFLSGFLNGSISISGPPVVLFLANQSTPKDVFRASISGYFFFLNMITIGFLISSNVLTKHVFNQYLHYLPFMIVGAYLGVVLAKKIPEKFFHSLTLKIILISGMILTVTQLRTIFF